MARFRVAGNLSIAFVIEVEAESQSSAESLVNSMDGKKIERESSLESLDTATVEITSSEEVGADGQPVDEEDDEDEEG